ncbi:Vav3 [Phodopus roborovskii]|uniref:Vav3 protein n=1 Tax=Phodopus roborovskii TaxID=109678 RepID=A0AAU9YXY5_PHORO|nr:Vav3 [Phodopus roborovskii]
MKKGLCGCSTFVSSIGAIRPLKVIGRKGRADENIDSFPKRLPKMQVIRNYTGTPPPALHEGPPLHIQAGDTVELLRGDAHSVFWQVPKPVDYSSQPWYAGPMERLQAETELINRVNSTYLVRHRTKESGEYAISIKYNNEAKHIKILTRDGFFHIAENRKFKSLMTLNCFFIVLSPKVLGIAIARYDFCARDMRELSLLKGDMVKIYTKMSANGWWRGEVNGRVGWFPSTYVEEDE